MNLVKRSDMFNSGWGLTFVLVSFIFLNKALKFKAQLITFLLAFNTFVKDAFVLSKLRIPLILISRIFQGFSKEAIISALFEIKTESYTHLNTKMLSLVQEFFLGKPSWHRLTNLLPMGSFLQRNVACRFFSVCTELFAHTKNVLVHRKALNQQVSRFIERYYLGMQLISDYNRIKQSDWLKGVRLLHNLVIIRQKCPPGNVKMVTFIANKVRRTYYKNLLNGNKKDFACLTTYQQRNILRFVISQHTRKKTLPVKHVKSPSNAFRSLIVLFYISNVYISIRTNYSSGIKELTKTDIKFNYLFVFWHSC